MKLLPHCFSIASWMPDARRECDCAMFSTSTSHSLLFCHARCACGGEGAGTDSIAPVDMALLCASLSCGLALAALEEVEPRRKDAQKKGTHTLWTSTADRPSPI